MRSSLLRKVVLLLTSVAGAGAVCLFLQPINSLTARALLLLAALLFIIGCLLLAWKRPAVRWTLLAFVACLVVFVLLPSRPADRDALRRSYTAALRSYQNSPYLWGGEGRSGIDCSGLPRRAFRDALLHEGLTTLNGGLIRDALRQWWYDASARALADGYRGYMVPLPLRGILRRIPYDTLRSGDVAVTQSGTHCLVYLEGDQWIQADPGDGAVAIYDARQTKNSWFDTPVGLYRWSQLE